MEINYCPVCGSEVNEEGMDWDAYDCPKCGTVYMEVWKYSPTFQHS